MIEIVVSFICTSRRLCLGSEHDAEIGAYLDQTADLGRKLVTLWWSGLHFLIAPRTDREYRKVCRLVTAHGTSAQAAPMRYGTAASRLRTRST